MKVLSRKFAFLFVAFIAVLNIGCGFTSHEVATDNAMAAPCRSPYTVTPESEWQFADRPLPKVGFVLIAS